MTAHKKYKAFTLVELLVVMGILVILGSFGFSAFDSLRSSVAMSEQILTLSQDLRHAQRAALFLERGSDERWIYGNGIDFTDLDSGNTYNLFKWCSQYNEYGASKTKGVVPNFDDTTIGGQNGTLPTNSYTYAKCNLDVAVSELVATSNINSQNFEDNFRISFPSSNNAPDDVGGIPKYVVFESVSGRAFFYDDSGNIVNFNSEGEMISEPIDLKFSIENDRLKTRKNIQIDNISGKVTIETEKM